MLKNINFVSKFKKANFISITIFILSIVFITFKGLNYGIDFKGGTLIELRTDTSINSSAIRDTLTSMNLGDINAFGKRWFSIKVEQKPVMTMNPISEVKTALINNLNAEDFRRNENVGPKVSTELLSSVIALSALCYAFIWVRFEWQFSVGSIIALFRVTITLGIFSVLSLEITYQ